MWYAAAARPAHDVVPRLMHWIRPPGPVARGLRIGLLGGSFNPPHRGHLHLSLAALKRLGLDYVWWLVTPRNPLKGYAGLAPLRDRMMQARGAACHPRIIPMDIEDTLGTHYTIDTVTALQRRFPELRFVWLMGSDNLAGFHRWRRWQDIARRIPIAVMARPGFVLSPLYSKAAQRFSANRLAGDIGRARPPAFRYLDGPRDAQSSTAIRAQLAGTEALVRVMPPC